MGVDGSARSTPRDAVATGSGLVALALAVWLLPASIHIVSWPASGPVRLALLAPAWQLLVAVAIAVVLAGGLVVGGWGSRAARIAGPLSLLWLWTIPYLPWIPDRAPLLLVLAGPIRWVILAVALAVVLGRAGVAAAVQTIPRLGRTTIFAISLVLYVVLGLHAVRAVGLGGDEPHYLIITESILKDGDLKIENNHQRGDYRSFIGGELRPDYMQRGKNGEIYSIHAPGLAVLVLPAYVLGGYLAVVAFIGFLGALTALAIFDVCDRLAGRSAAILTWVAVCLTVPFVPYSWMIFPEMPGALIVAWSVLWLSDTRDQSVLRWLVRGLVLASLPWLHTKFIVFLAIFAAAFAFRLLRRMTALLAFSLPIAGSGLAWLYSFYVIYGDFSPDAPYGVYSDVNVINRYIPHGLIGIFLDQKFGLLFYSPIYLVAIAGAWYLWKRVDTRFLASVLLVAVAAFVGSTARLYMFWGGNSAPARFLVPILPCLAPMIALAFAQFQSVFARGLVGLWLAISVGLAASGTIWPQRLLLFSDPHGRARILESIQAGSPLALVVPTFTDPDWLSQVPQLGVWAVAAGVALLLAWGSARLPRASAWKVATTAALSFLAVAAVLTASPSAAVREATAARGDADVLWAYDGHRHRTLNYASLARVSPGAEWQRLLTMTLLPGTVNETGYVTPSFALPPGAFDAVISFAGPMAHDGEVRIEAPPRATFGSARGSLENPTTVPFVLPVGVRRLQVRVGDKSAGGAVSNVQIVPRAIVPPSEQQDPPYRAIESIPGREDAYLIYGDDQAYPEGGVFWTRATEPTDVFVSPGSASRLKLTVALGPNSGQIALRIGERVETVSVPAHDSRDVLVDLPRNGRLLPIHVQSPVMFRPSEVDPSSKDMRRLGCQVRVTLQ